MLLLLQNCNSSAVEDSWRKEYSLDKQVFKYDLRNYKQEGSGTGALFIETVLLSSMSVSSLFSCMDQGVSCVLAVVSESAESNGQLFQMSKR